MERTFLKSELQKRLVDTLPGGIVIYKIGETIETQYFSDGILKLSGHSREEYEALVKDNPIEQLTYEDDRADMLSKIATALETGAPLSMTYRIIHKNGSLVWVQLSATMIEEQPDGKIYYAIFTRLTEEAEIYKNIAEHASIAIFIAERKTRKVIFANRAWKQLRLLDPDVDVVGRRLQELMPPEDVLYTDQELLELPYDHFVESHVVSSDGKYLGISGRSIDWSGYDAYVCYISDESKLGDRHNRLQQLIDRIPSGISIYEIDDQKINLTYVNHAFWELPGDTSQYRGEKILDIVHPDDRKIVLSAVDGLRQGRNLCDIHFRIVISPGEWGWIRLVGSVVERVGRKMTVYCCYSNFDLFMKTQEELQTNRAMLDAALKSAKVLVWKYDYRTKTVTDSGSLGPAAGLPKEIENVPESLIEAGFIQEESIEDFRKMFEELSEKEEVSYDIYCSPLVKGKAAWQRQIYTPVFDQEGNYLEHIGTAIDVTEQKEREKRYEEEIRLKRLLSNNALAVAHFNLTKNMVTDSDFREFNLEQIIKSAVNADEMLVKIREAVSEPLEKKAFDVVCDCKTLLKHFKEGERHFEIRHHLQDDVRWLESRFDLISNPYTGDVEVIAVLRDISELVMTEETVKKLMEIDYESITTIDAETGEAKPFTKGHIDDVIQEQKTVGDNVAGVESYLRKFCDDQDVERIIRETSLPFVKKKLAEESIHMVTYTLRINQKEIHKRVIYTYLDSDKKVILCAMQDISETYRNELRQKKRLASALKEAEQASHAKTDFFSRMSHDMRTPMNGILGIAELSAEENDIDVMKRNMAKISESGKYLLSLINDTLDWQRIESGKMALDIRIVPVQTTIENIIDIIRPTAEAKKIKFNMVNDNAEMDWYVRLDAVRVKQIFINLLSNAVKFTPEGGTVTFEFHCFAREGMISYNRVRITDTGVGISEEFLKGGLFQPFSQEGNEVSTRYSGSGLGLSIVYRLVEMMGGRIEVESEVGKGTTFTVYLDFERVNRKEAEEYIKKHEKKQSVMKESLEGRHILLVEDYPLNAEIAKTILYKMGCQVTWADNGAKGLEVFSASNPHEFDAILMDVRMPVMNGLEASREIRQLERDDAKRIPIIAMTANAYEEDVRQCLEAGMNHHLPKPFEPTELFETLVRYIKD